MVTARYYSPARSAKWGRARSITPRIPGAIEGPAAKYISLQTVWARVSLVLVGQGTGACLWEALVTKRMNLMNSKCRKIEYGIAAETVLVFVTTVVRTQG